MKLIKLISCLEARPSSATTHGSQCEHKIRLYHKPMKFIAQEIDSTFLFSIMTELVIAWSIDQLCILLFITDVITENKSELRTKKHPTENYIRTNESC